MTLDEKKNHLSLVTKKGCSPTNEQATISNASQITHTVDDSTRR
jgi:hypothetical protein